MIINEALQLDVLRYVTKNKKLFKKFVPDVFNQDLYLLFQVYQEYFKEVEDLPKTSSTLINYFDIHALELGADTEDLQMYIKNLIVKSFEPLNFDLQYVKTNCIDIAKRLSLINLMGAFADGVQDLSTTFDYEYFLKEAKKIGRFKEADQTGLFLYRDVEKLAFAEPKIFKSEWEVLNSWRKKGGFYSPEMYIIMASMKSFKTTNLMNLALGFTRNTKAKVLYIDTENGTANLAQRGLQAITGKTYEEFDLKIAKNRGEQYRVFYDNADIYIQYLEPGSTIDDVADILDYLETEEKFIPDCIIYDDLDHFKPSEWSKDRFERLAQVYKDAISLNVLRGTFSFAASQIGREAIDKKTIRMADISGAIAKIALAHGIFAISATDEEREAGIFRLMPVAQREGKGAHPDRFAYMRVYPETQIIREMGENDEDLVQFLASNGQEVIDTSKKVDMKNFKIKLNDR